MIHCHDCTMAELSEERSKATLSRRVMLTVVMALTQREEQRRQASPFAGVSRVFATAIGGRCYTPYDLHRAEYEKTGDERELTRALRHMDPA